MMLLLKYLLIVSIKVHLLIANICDVQLDNCNDEGNCIEINGQPHCDCLETIYTGNRCQQLTDHCTNLPCQNNGQCQ